MVDLRSVVIYLPRRTIQFTVGELTNEFLDNNDARAKVATITRYEDDTIKIWFENDNTPWIYGNVPYSGTPIFQGNPQVRPVLL